jgi:4-hydroxymandelate oxidase
MQPPAHAAAAAAAVGVAAVVLLVAWARRSREDDEGLESEPSTLLVSVGDYEAAARRVLSRRRGAQAGVLDYFFGGAGDGLSQQRTTNALARVLLRPRVLCDVSSPSLSHTLLGRPTGAPFGIAPTAFHGLLTADGELATARAAAAADVVYCVSSSASVPFATVAAGVPSGRRLAQLYFRTTREANAAVIAAAEAAGAEAIVLTVDRPVLGTRNANQRSGFSIPTSATPSAAAASDSKASACAYHDSTISDRLNWDDVAWLVRQTRLPIVLKGILTGEDGAAAVAAGVAGVWVSTHGGRQLDGVASPVEALVEVRAAVRAAEAEAEARGRSAAAAPRVAVWVDGGVRRGTDVVKYLALGADHVWVGLAVIAGLAVRGEEGVAAVLRILAEETTTAMQLLGARRVADILPSHVRFTAPADW